MATTPTLQSPSRPTTNEGAARSAQAYEQFISQLRAKMRENPNFAQLAQDPSSRQQMLGTVRNSLIGSVPRFQQLSEADQGQFTEQALNRALAKDIGDVTQEAIETAAPLIGATVGGATGGIPGAAAGTALGTIIPEATRPLTTGELPRFMDMIKQTAINVPLVAAAEGLTRPIMAKLGQMRKSLILGRAADSPAAIEARSVLEPGLRARGFAMTPKQISRDQLPPMREFIETVAESGLGSRGIIQAQRQATDDVIAQAAGALEQHLVNGLRTNEAAAEMFLNQANAREFYARTISSMKHRIVDDISKKGVKVDTKDIVNMAQGGVTAKTLFQHFKVPEIRDKAGQVIRPEAVGQDGFLLMMNGLSPMGSRRTSFADADRARSVLLEIGRDFGGANASGADKQVAKLATNMAERLRGSMDTAARALDPKAAAAYANAKAFHKAEVIDKFDNTLYKTIVRAVEKEPGKFSQYVLSPENIDKLGIIKEMSGTGQLGAWPDIQGRLLQHIITRAAEKESLGLGLGLNVAGSQGFLKRISGKAIASQVKSLGEEGERMLLEGSAGLAFKRFTNALEAASQRPGGAGKIGTVMAQFGAITALSGGALSFLSGGDYAAVANSAVGTGLVLMLTPRAFAKILTNKELMTNVANGVIGGPKSAAFGRMLQNVALLNQQIQAEMGGSFQQLLSRASSSPQALLPQGADPAFRQGQ